jgi:hypothetical protein
MSSYYSSEGPGDDMVFNAIPHISGGSVSGSYAEMNGLSNSIENTSIKTKFMHNHQSLETALDFQETGISYIFMTKPDLNLSGNTGKVGFFDKMAGSYEYNSLCSGGGSNFIPILSNMYRSISLEDYSTMEGSYGDTYRGYTQKLPTTAGTSKGGGGSFSVTYDETADSSVTKLHKLWFDYIEYVKFGQFVPDSSYVGSHSIDYVASLYFFSCRPDGHTISMWGKYSGVIPQNVPYSSFGGDIGNRGLVSLTCSYIYTFKEYMETEILEEFNAISGGGGSVLKKDNAFSSSVTVTSSGKNFYLAFD